MRQALVTGAASGIGAALVELLRGKYDAFVLQRLAKLFRRESVDAVVTVGAGDQVTVRPRVRVSVPDRP